MLESLLGYADPDPNPNQATRDMSVAVERGLAEAARWAAADVEAAAVAEGPGSAGPMRAEGLRVVQARQRA